MCLTPWRSIISWKIWPPVMPTNEWAISCARSGCNGCTLPQSARLKADAGGARACVCEAAAAVLCVLTSSLTTFAAAAAAAWAGRVSGDDWARAADVENERVPLMAAMARDRDCCMAGGASGHDWRVQSQGREKGD